MTSSATAIEVLAARLRDAERTHRPIAPIRGEVNDASVDLAYRIQQENVRFRIAGGHRSVGWKIGLTSTAVQRQLGVDQPDFGVLFEDMETPDGGCIDLARLIQPKIEAEIAFVLARSLDHPTVSRHDVVAATDHVLACLEIVDSRIENWNIGIFDTIADNASSARFVLGSIPRRVHDVDLIHCGMVLRANGAVVATGAGAATLGDPVEAVRWLAARAAETERPLRAGDIVLSGALGPMIAAGAGGHYATSIAGLGCAAVSFSAVPA